MDKTVFFIGFLALTSLTACKQHKEEEKKEAVEYTVTTPIVMDTTYSKDYVAQIQSIQNVELRAQEKGYLEGFKIDEGQFVRGGQVLFNIMPRLYEAELAKAAAETKTVELEMLNVKTLAEKNIVSQTELAIAKAKYEQAKAAQALAQTHLSFTEIKAPFDGTVDRIRFKKGSLIDEGTVLTTISDNRNVFAYFNVSEIEYLNYKSRNDVKNTVSLILSNGMEHKYKGVIETIESEFDNSTGNIAFRAKFPNPDLLLKHGETGKVRMTMPFKNAMIIPQKATYEIQDKTFVYVYDEKTHVVKSKEVVVKQRLSNLYIIESGLSSEDRILLDGIQLVNDDDKIEAKELPIREVMAKLQLIPQANDAKKAAPIVSKEEQPEKKEEHHK
ncbi:MAG: efflux RND transporter periplasmic adaptor subunit [Saprospiraceae bacterium]|nr:efflux RND transporter periplasmic adaptor subunit [Saprospiraceae bacterium]